MFVIKWFLIFVILSSLKHLSNLLLGKYKSACFAVCNVSKFSVKELRLCSQPQWQDYGLCETEFLGCDSFHLTLMLCSGHFDQERIFFLPKMLLNVIELD